jgi:hypothetical protein
MLASIRFSTTMDEFGQNLITIENDGNTIRKTDFWDSAYAKKGLFYLSGNAGAWRLLVPDNCQSLLSEMATGKYAEMELSTHAGVPAVIIWFVDGTRTPYRLLLDLRSVERKITRTKSRSPLLIYTRKGLQQTLMIRKIL